MDHSSAAEQRATAVAKLKRAASLPRMKDGRRPPMHVEAVSEGERSQGEERDVGDCQEEVERGRNGREGKSSEEGESANEVSKGKDARPGATSEVEATTDAEAVGESLGPVELQTEEGDGEEGDAPPNGTVPAAESVKTARKRRSRSRTRSRGSKDMKGKAMAKHSPPFSSASHTNESSADENYTSGPGEDPPPSPPLISPIPSNFAGFQASRFLRSPITPVVPLFYPGTSPSTPLPSLDDIQKSVGAGLFRSNSAGAARAMAMSKLTGEPIDLTLISSASPAPSKLTRNNTVAGGERMAARRMLLNRLGNRLNNQTDGEQTSGGEEAPPVPLTTTKRRRRRSHRRSSSRASTVVDDRDDREPSTTPNTPLVPPSPLPLFFRNTPEPFFRNTPEPFFRNTPEPPRSASSASRRAHGEAERASPRPAPNENAPYTLGHRGVVIEDEDDLPDRMSPIRPPTLPTTPARTHRPLAGPRLPHTSDAPSNASADSPGAVTVPMFLSHNASFRQDLFPASPFQTPLKEPVYPDEDEVLSPQESRSRSRLATATSAFDRDSEISWVDPGEFFNVLLQCISLMPPLL